MIYFSNTNCNIWRITCILISLSYVAQCKEPTFICYLNTRYDSMEVSLNNASALFNTQYCNNSCERIYFYGAGFAQRSYSEKVLTVVDAFLQVQSTCVCLLQWDDQANSYLNSVLDPIHVQTIVVNYFWVATIGVQEAFIAAGRALYDMYQAGMDLQKVHLIGHSLAAHGWGYSCRELKNHTGGASVYRITALDPASILYQYPLTIMQPVGSDCADFVDGFHTDPKHFGNKNALGHLDIWVNLKYYNNQTRLPGCPEDVMLFSSDDFCSHQQAVEIYKNSLTDPTSFLASQANDIEEWSAGIQGPQTYVGIYTNTKLRGNFYLCTNPTYPYGKGREGIEPDKCILPNTTT